MTAVLEQLDHTLRGPRRARADMLAEIRDGLDDAAEAYRAAGLPPEDARRRAEADFGDPAPVAEGLQAELAARYGLRSALAMVVVIPALTFMWDLLWQAAPQTTWRPSTPLVSLLSDVIDNASLATALCCGLAVVVFATGLRVPPSWTLRALGYAVIGGVTLIVTSSVGMQFVGASAHADHLPSFLAASVVSFCTAVGLVWSAVRCLRFSGA